MPPSHPESNFPYVVCVCKYRVSLLYNWRCIFIEKVETFENVYKMSFFIAKVRETFYLWFMFWLISGLCFKLWQFNTKIDLKNNTKFLIITDRIITCKCQSIKSHFYVNLAFSHVMVIVTFSTMYKSHLVLLKEQEKVVNRFHDVNIEMEIECIWKSQSIIQAIIVLVIKTICINLILKSTLIAFKCITLLIIMLVDSFYFLELFRK